MRITCDILKNIKIMSRLLFSCNKLFVDHFKKSFHLRSKSYFALIYEEYGDPSKVIKKKEISDVYNESLNANQVLIEYMASPINPADINTIQGVYAIKPNLPAFAGNEGVAKVIKVGANVNNLKNGDWVIPSVAGSGWGTWRDIAIADNNDLLRIDNSIDLLSAAQLRVNPCTAYRMLKDFVNLNKGDTVIQNGANSAVGINVIQLAKYWGFKTLNVVRNRPDFDELRTKLTSLGADVVITEEELRQSDIMFKIFNDTAKPKLALNCVGGKNATDCMRHLDSDGVMVTYGGMSKQPLVIPTGSLIFKDHRFYGFWMTRWNQKNSQSDESSTMINFLCDLIKAKKLVSPECQTISLDNYKEAFEKSMQGFIGRKYVFTMN